LSVSQMCGLEKIKATSTAARLASGSCGCVRTAFDRIAVIFYHDVLNT
jgi:hypothetical protein